MKKITVVAIICIMLMSLAVLADSPKNEFDVSVKRSGADITLDFVFDREITISGHQIELEYNAEFFEYAGYTPKSEYNKFDVADTANPKKGKVKVILANYQPQTVNGDLMSIEFKLLKPVRYSDFQFGAGASKGNPNICWNIPKLGGFSADISDVSLHGDTADISVKYFRAEPETYDASLYIASYAGGKLVYVEKTDISDCLESNSLKIMNFPAKDCTEIKAVILQNGSYEPLSIPGEFIFGGIE